MRKRRCVRLLAGGADCGMSHSLFRVSQDLTAFQPHHHIRGQHSQGNRSPSLYVVKNQGDTKTRHSSEGQDEHTNKKGHAKFPNLHWRGLVCGICAHIMPAQLGFSTLVHSVQIKQALCRIQRRFLSLGALVLVLYLIFTCVTNP